MWTRKYQRKKGLLTAVKNKTAYKELLIGLDLGSSAVNIAQLHFRASGKDTLKAAGFEIPPGLSDQAKEKFIVEGIKRLITENRISGVQACVAIPDSEACVRSITVPHMQQQELPEALKWASKRFVAYPLEEISMAYKVIGEAEEAGTKKLKVVLLAIQKSFFQKQLDLLQKTGLKIVGITSGSFAIGNMLSLSNKPMKSTVVAMDIGSGGTSITFFQDNHLVFTRYIPEGQDSFDEALREISGARELKAKLGVTVSDANAAQSDLELSKYTVAAQDYLGKLVRELSLSFSHYSQISHGNLAEKVILYGAGLGLRGLDSALEKEIKLPVRLIEPQETVFTKEQMAQAKTIPNFGAFAVSLGLSLETGTSPDLLRKERKLRIGGLLIEQVPKRFIIIAASLVILCFVWLLGVNIISGFRLKDARFRLNQLQSGNTRLAVLTRTVLGLKARKELFENIYGAEFPFQDILLKLNSALNNKTNLILNSLSIEGQKPGFIMVMHGEIEDIPDMPATRTLTDFIALLDNTGYFDKINPSIEQGVSTGKKSRVLIFTIKSPLKM